MQAVPQDILGHFRTGTTIIVHTVSGVSSDRDWLGRGACLGACIVQRWPQCMQQVCQGSRIEEVPQLRGEDPELLHEVPAVLRARRSDALQHLLCGDQILGPSIPVQLVLRTEPVRYRSTSLTSLHLIGGGQILRPSIPVQLVLCTEPITVHPA